MKRFWIFVIILIVVVLGFTAADIWRARSFISRVQRVNIGDNKARVVALLGRATSEFMPPKPIPPGWWLGVHVETWAYGKRFDWGNCLYSRFPFIWPFKVRLFGPDADDVEIEFDSNGTVSRVLLSGK